ncbi:hypothetical protein Tcan_02696 [Toxocara canis]|uniref:Uncharacterized protein n=1 Tax=Toxocara canis TaxID=6265 RepID=A0A0B2VKJ8_TOXCA|nr:hypothetical protein Tcan_02696 [Toxocara canis]
MSRPPLRDEEGAEFYTKKLMPIAKTDNARRRVTECARQLSGFGPGRLAAASGGGCGNGVGRSCGRAISEVETAATAELVAVNPSTSSGSGYSGGSPIGGAQVKTIDGGNGQRGLDDERNDALTGCLRALCTMAQCFPSMRKLIRADKSIAQFNGPVLGRPRPPR